MNMFFWLGFLMRGLSMAKLIHAIPAFRQATWRKASWPTSPRGHGEVFPLAETHGVFTVNSAWGKSHGFLTLVFNRGFPNKKKWPNFLPFLKYFKMVFQEKPWETMFNGVSPMFLMVLAPMFSRVARMVLVSSVMKPDTPLVKPACCSMAWARLRSSSLVFFFCLIGRL